MIVRILTHGQYDVPDDALDDLNAVDERIVEAVEAGDVDSFSAALAQLVDVVQAKVEAFRTRKETIKATYTAAEAQTKIGEAVSGISEEMGDVGTAMQRAEDKIATMQARAGAIDDLLASGALDDATASSDPIQAELDRVTATSGVDGELARMKAELGAGAPKGAIEAPKDGER